MVFSSSLSLGTHSGFGYMVSFYTPSKPPRLTARFTKVVASIHDPPLSKKQQKQRASRIVRWLPRGRKRDTCASNGVWQPTAADHDSECQVPPVNAQQQTIAPTMPMDPTDRAKGVGWSMFTTDTPSWDLLGTETMSVFSFLTTSFSASQGDSSDYDGL